MIAVELRTRVQKTPREEVSRFFPRLDPWGVSTSRGPASVWRRTRRRSSPRRRASARRPAVPAERLRVLVSTGTLPGPLLQSGMPGGRAALAALAGCTDVSGHSAWQRVSSSAKLPVPRAAAGTAARSGGPPGSGRGQPGRTARGPAPSRNSGRFAKFSLRPAGLLRVVRAAASLAPATFLLVGLPQGVTASRATGTSSARAPPPGDSTTPSSVAQPSGELTSCVVRYFLCRQSVRNLMLTPEEEGAGGIWRVPSPRFLLRKGAENGRSV